ncbi:MAG: winged helix-turn-helix transcriptional regulator [Cytophagales bacterium]|nr:winged helix-turn-helix transcriptional regulator [Cytophagales bacterium]
MENMESTLTDHKLEAVAFVLKTIAHPTRIAIITLLRKNSKLSVNEICENLGGLDQSLTSHHLSNMKLKGVLGSKKEGRNMYYFLKLEEVTGVIDCIENCKVNF